MSGAKTAVLQMYDWPETRVQSDAFWLAIRQRLESVGIDAPKHLLHGAASLTDPDLLLGQTCGYPLATSLRDKVQYVTTPVYAVDGCTGTQYSSAIIAHESSRFDLSSMAEQTFAYNAGDSLSGYRVIRAMFDAPEAFFKYTILSGGHRKSAQMVAQGRADVAAIDAVCWHMVQQFDPEIARNLRVVGWTPLHPSLPMITSLNTDSQTITALRQVLKDVAQTPVARALNITGFDEVPLAQYLALSAL